MLKKTCPNRDLHLFTYERDYYSRGFKNIAGLDEAGRGPLAGPVVSSVVILHENGIIPGVFDSKQLTPKQRASLYNDILKNAKAVGIGIVDNVTIDKINILQATILSMKRALQVINIIPDMLFLDGMSLPNMTVPQKKIIRGDSKSQSIAAASIIAKVFRDRLMEHYHEKYPAYNFKQHKGYGTKEHLENIRQFGSTSIHRQSFKGVKFI